MKDNSTNYIEELQKHYDEEFEKEKNEYHNELLNRLYDLGKKNWMEEYNNEIVKAINERFALDWNSVDKWLQENHTKQDVKEILYQMCNNQFVSGIHFVLDKICKEK